MRRILDAVVGAVTVPVTLKMRTGWDPQQRNGVTVARLAEEAGIAALAVHGRTRACMYGGHAEYETIRRIKRAVKLPVFANGDIDSPRKARQVLEQTGADGLMIGCAAQGSPWIFRQIGEYLRSGRVLPEPGAGEVRDIMLHHLDNLYLFYGEVTGTRVARKHLSWYCKGRPGAEQYRAKVVRADSAVQQLRLTREFFSGVPAPAAGPTA